MSSDSIPGPKDGANGLKKERNISKNRLQKHY